MTVIKHKGKIFGYLCDVATCLHKWTPRKDGIPRVCPKCKNVYWNKH